MRDLGQIAFGAALAFFFPSMEEWKEKPPETFGPPFASDIPSAENGYLFRGPNRRSNPQTPLPLLTQQKIFLLPGWCWW